MDIGQLVYFPNYSNELTPGIVLDITKHGDIRIGDGTKIWMIKQHLVVSDGLQDALHNSQKTL